MRREKKGKKNKRHAKKRREKKVHQKRVEKAQRENRWWTPQEPMSGWLTPKPTPNASKTEIFHPYTLNGEPVTIEGVPEWMRAQGLTPDTQTVELLRAALVRLGHLDIEMVRAPTTSCERVRTVSEMIELHTLETHSEVLAALGWSTPGPYSR